MYMCYSYFMMMLSLLVFFFSLNLYSVSLDLMIEWSIFNFNSFTVELFFLIDWVSCLFMSVVLLISSMVVLYSVEYMSGDKTLDRFLYLVFFFVISMLIMVLSPSLVSILFGWDMLGLVSYCLVIYYQSYYSFNSGMVTVLSNRIGDVGLLIGVGLMVMYGSWNMYSLEGGNWLVVAMILLAALTKSAQIPFSAWLPMAMAAPTPVSSLVHSSTLVTAGVYLLMRFSTWVMEVSIIKMILLILSIFTMFMSGFMANYEYDLKKIIALSTLSQLGLMMMILSLGLSVLSFYHLLTHAVFKSLLFLCSGVIIHSMKGNQDIRYYGNLGSASPYVTMSFFISVFALMGFPFLAGFYSKDLIIEVIYFMEMKILFMWLIMLSLIFTVSYSLRLGYYLYLGTMKFESMSGLSVHENFLMNFSMIVLMLLSVIFGSVLNWIFFFDFYLILVSGVLKMLVLFMMMMGVLNMVFQEFVKDKKKSLVLLFSASMWLMNIFYKSLFKNVLNFGGHISLGDLTWVEVLEVRSLSMVKLLLMKVYYFKYKLYYIIFNHLFILILLGIFALI